MLRLLGSRMISKQESCHLVLGTPMVSCSHMFIKINLRNTKVRRVNLASVYNADEISESNKTPEERLRDGEMETNNNLEKMTILDLYGRRMEKCHWLNDYEFDLANHNHNFLTMSLYSFTKEFYAGNVCGGTQWIKKHTKNKYIVMFSPYLSSEEEGENFGEFCKYELIKYRPYVGEIENAYNSLTDNSEIKQLWKDHQAYLKSNDCPVPGTVSKLFQTKRFKKPKGTLPGTGDKDGRGEDSNTNENMDNVLNSNVYLNDQTINSSQSGRLDNTVDAGDIGLRWDKNYDFSNHVQIYEDGTDFVSISEMFDNFLAGEIDRTVTRTDRLYVTLKPSQKIAHDVIVEAAVQPFGTSRTENESENNLFSRLIIMNGRGGAGKSYTIDAILTTLVNKHEFGEDCYLKLATTGKAACVIGGYTVHSHKFGMGLPIGNAKYKKITHNRLKDEQTRLRELKIIFLDEYSMLRRKELYYISERLKQIKNNDLLFGGLCVVLVGDPAQLPPVQADSLWVKRLPSTKIEDVHGNTIYNQFSDVVILKENNRLDATDPESTDFYEILESVRDGKMNEKYRQMLIDKCSMYRMGMQKFAAVGFEDDGVSRLFVTNKDSEEYNQTQLLKLQKNNNSKIAKITAVNSVGAKSFSNSKANGVPNQIFLCVGAKVLLTKNLKQAANLVNGSTGIVKDIIYAENETPANNLPMYVIVDFGDSYTGESFFGDDVEKRGWVPIKPTVAEFFSYGTDKYVQHTRTQIPLKLCWGLTVWKSQGSTFNEKFCINIGTREAEHGLTYVALSRATKLSQIAFISAITGTRMNSINNHSKLGPRVAHEADLLRKSILTEERLRRIIDNS